MSGYKKLETLDVYILARKASKKAWEIYIKLELDQKIIMGQQFVKAIDSICANISEGYCRYHYLDKVRFYYIARASLSESITWTELLYERGAISRNEYDILIDILNDTHKKLNGYIQYNLNQKQNSSNNQTQ